MTMLAPLALPPCWCLPRGTDGAVQAASSAALAASESAFAAAVHTESLDAVDWAMQRQQAAKERNLLHQKRLHLGVKRAFNKTESQRSHGESTVRGRRQQERAHVESTMRGRRQQERAHVESTVRVPAYIKRCARRRAAHSGSPGRGDCAEKRA